MWWTVLVAVIGWVEQLATETPGSPPQPLPPLIVNFGGHTYQFVATGQKVS